MPWSYNAGERGKGNWVRAYEDPKYTLSLMLEWFEPVMDEHNRPVINERSGKPFTRRRRIKADTLDCRTAEDRARKLSDEFTSAVPGTAHSLIDAYLQEGPSKGESKSAHDQRAAQLFKALLPADLLASKMDRTQWDAFIAKRRAGELCGLRPVGNRMIAYDLKFMISVLGWSVGTGWLKSHPWGPDIRRTQKWGMPKNPTPRRPAMTDEIRTLLIRHSASWRFELALELGRETISRNASVRMLQWIDLDFAQETVSWRNEKNGWECVTPLTARAIELLRKAPSRGIGQAWVFPMESDPTRPCSRHYFQLCLKRAKASLLRAIAKCDGSEASDQMRARLRGLGFHGEKRAAIRNPQFRELPAKVREQLARTTEITQRTVYDEVSIDELRAAQRRIS